MGRGFRLGKGEAPNLKTGSEADKFVVRESFSQ